MYEPKPERVTLTHPKLSSPVSVLRKAARAWMKRGWAEEATPPLSTPEIPTPPAKPANRKAGE